MVELVFVGLMRAFVQKSCSMFGCRVSYPGRTFGFGIGKYFRFMHMLYDGYSVSVFKYLSGSDTIYYYDIFGTLDTSIYLYICISLPFFWRI